MDYGGTRNVKGIFHYLKIFQFRGEDKSIILLGNSANEGTEVDNQLYLSFTGKVDDYVAF